jgi:hypothetical protein
LTTRDWAALHWLVLCCDYSFAYATADLPIDTALHTLSTVPESQTALDANSTSPDQQHLSQQVQSHLLLQDDMQILWPMMPKETLAKLAYGFYPDSPILAQRFIQKSVRLSRVLGVNVDPNAPFQHAQIIAIPNEKEVRALTHRIKKTEELTPSQEQLKLSYQLKQIIPPPSKPQHNSHHTTVATVSTGSGGQDLLDVNLQHAWHSLFAKAAHGVQSAKVAFSDWDAGFISIKSNAQTNTFKIILGIGLMLMLGLLGWGLQKRHFQRKEALLNTIETSLIEPTISDMTADDVALPEDSEFQAERIRRT